MTALDTLGGNLGARDWWVEGTSCPAGSGSVVQHNYWCRAPPHHLIGGGARHKPVVEAN